MARVLVLMLAFSLAPSALPAQTRPSAAPFETIDLGLTLLGDLADGAMQGRWSPGPAVGLGMSMPFHLGSIETGLQYAHPSARRDVVPGFRSLLAYVGWGGGHDLGRGFTAGAGLRVGIMAMRFDGDTIPEFRRSESELGIATRVVLRWMPRRAWFTEVGLSYQSVLTTPRMEQVFLSAGVGRRFTSPEWLREFLD